jgi:hypothetical protein
MNTSTNSRLRRLAPALVLVLAAMLCSSCGKANNQKPVFPVHGKIVYEGQPLPHAFIVFHSLGDPGAKPVRPTAYGQDDGSFTLTTYAAKDGAPAGEYAVTVECRIPPIDDNGKPGRNILPPRYLRPETSGLRVQLAEGPNELEPLVLSSR